jgi:glycosyltransferase involved in cell wall biosynthesis
MNNKPVISVLMPVYNNASYLVEAIDSVLNQTYKAFELIIIDDCSTDDTLSLLEQYRDERIVLIRKAEHSGLVASLNMGLDMAGGEFIARMDGDDICFADRFEKQVSFLREKVDVDICGGSYQVIGTGELVYFPAGHEQIKFYSLEFCPMCHPAIMFRKRFLDKYELRYAPGFEGSEDYELWTRSVWLGKLANLPDILLAYRVHPEQVSRTNRQNQVSNSMRCRLYMWGKVYEGAAFDDPLTQELLLQNLQFTVPGTLRQVMGRLDDLIRINDEKKLYDPVLFLPYMEQKKQQVVRRFFLKQRAYAPGIFFQMIKIDPAFRKCFNALEYLKIALKSAVGWHKDIAEG